MELLAIIVGTILGPIFLYFPVVLIVLAKNRKTSSKIIAATVVFILPTIGSIIFQQIVESALLNGKQAALVPRYWQYVASIFGLILGWLVYVVFRVIGKPVPPNNETQNNVRIRH